MCAIRLHVDGRTWNRRQILAAGLGVAAAWPMLGRPESAIARKFVGTSDYPFSLGVASGDPTPDGFVLWTRLAPKPLEAGGMPPENVRVGWQVASDDKFTKIAAEGSAVATPELAHSVHIEVPGLAPNRWYFYRFTTAAAESPIGRARTAPAPDDLPGRLRMAFASCQHYESGLFTAYQHMVEEELDVIAHLGDYIYEGAASKATPIRKHVGPLLRQLVDYRNRHAQYKTDEHLQAAHAKCPWLVTWDDHEFANNCAGLISEKLDDDPSAYLVRRAAAYQAYYEHMPLRMAQLPHGPDMLLYRQVKFGRLADFAVLDTRQYRTDQPCGDGNKPPCDAVYDPKATLLGDAQEQWLYRKLDASTAAWNVLTQQIMIARVDRKPGQEIGYSMDQWPGYEANRQRVLKYFAEHPKLNPVAIAGDIHCHWANDLKLDDGDEKSPVVGAEFVGTSISSGGDGTEQRKETPDLLRENPFVRFFNNERGYVACDITPEQWTTHYRTVPYVTKPGAPLVTRRTMVVEAGRRGMHVL
jgi:alkaline phosphatase D